MSETQVPLFLLVAPLILLLVVVPQALGIWVGHRGRRTRHRVLVGLSVVGPALVFLLISVVLNASASVIGPWFQSANDIAYFEGVARLGRGVVFHLVAAGLLQLLFSYYWRRTPANAL